MLSGGESACSARVCLFEHSPCVVMHPPQPPERSPFSSTQLTAGIVPGRTLLFRSCSELGYDRWPLDLLPVTLISVIVLTFLLIPLCIRPKTVCSHDTADLWWLSVHLGNLETVMCKSHYSQAPPPRAGVDLPAVHVLCSTAQPCALQLAALS